MAADNGVNSGGVEGPGLVGLPCKVTTESGEGFAFFLAFPPLPEVSVKAGFKGIGGSSLSTDGLDVVTIFVIRDLRMIPPPNLANASCTEESLKFDPKVGVPQRELARSMASESSLYICCSSSSPRLTSHSSVLAPEYSKLAEEPDS